ncbi:MAG: DUF1460 domain-containing protein [Odoribacteraceae bacterium]|jgi:cell wall-associated NlpC family hydrolase|nr:DUF1460 domain-containing protein [Odoribacteraceae bacterium]
MLITIALLLALLPASNGDTIPARERTALERYRDHARQHHFAELSPAARVVATGRYLLGTPYRAGTLDDGEQEHLIINLAHLDCVTFIDNVLALALTDARDKEAITTHFPRNLRRLRYRDGKITDYSSRLHYSTDWLFEMQRQGILRDVTGDTTGLPRVNPVGYLSRHHDNNPALRGNAAMIARVAAIERIINARNTRYLPKNRVETRAGQLREGDIILITTTREGLDTSHVGIAVEVEGNIHLLHASTDAGKVSITTAPLRHYLQSMPRHAGIIAARLANTEKLNNHVK